MYVWYFVLKCALLFAYLFWFYHICKFILSSPVYRLRDWGLERLNVKNTEEVISWGRYWKDHCFKKNLEDAKRLGNESFNKHCCIPVSKMIRKSFLALGSLFWRSDIVVFKGKHIHTFTDTHPGVWCSKTKF